MKKILYFILFAFAITFNSCSWNKPGYTGSVGNGITYKNVTHADSYYAIVEITYDNHTHEFIVINGTHRGGIEHWPECKYCKQNNY